MVARGRRLHFAPVSVTDAVVDVDLGRSIRARTASFRADPTKDDNATVRTPFMWPDVPRPVSAPLASFVPEDRRLDFTRAIALCLYDYTRKSWCRGWVVSLSGGADSAAVASLCAHAIGLAVEELGIDTVWNTFRYALGAPPETPTVHEMVQRMLTTVYQGTVNSSDTTRSAAVDVARGLGARHVEWEVDPLVSACTERVAAALGRDLTWDTDDIALQNIQARVRSPGVWMLANAESKLLLATSNRSEAAVGYATMDGDTSGGLSPIAGIDKAFLRAWLQWMEQTGTPERGPIPALRAVNVQQPTAELRPQSMNQTDEDDLMPYPVLDEIERLAIRDKYTPLSVFRHMRSQYPDSTAAVVGGWVRRFFKLWCRNQWKRERYAPGFHVDDKNLDPRTWCRFPILSSGFKRELAELEHLVGALVAEERVG
ncbi:MAG TPA: NAD(+) synthase [Deltaproteobacteria bacterium]|nr:NAD(+) synthase [Deltaproteobacteria bacterium]